MAASKKQQLTIGFFVLMAMISAGILIVIFGDSDGLRRSYHVVCKIDSTGSPVKRGAPVWMMGNKVGKVTAIRIELKAPPHVLIDMQLYDQYKIRADSILKVEQKGVVGDSVVQIYPGTHGDFVKEGGVIQGEAPVNMGELFKDVRNTVVKLDKVAGQLHVSMDHIIKLIGTEAFVDNIHGSASEIYEASKNANRLLRSSEDLVVKTKDEIRQISERLQKLADSTEGEIKTLATSGGDLLKHLDESNTEFKKFVVQITETEKLLNQIFDDIAKGQGSLGRLIEEDEFADELNETFVSLRRLIAEIRNDPSQVFWGKEQKKRKRELSLEEVLALNKEGLKSTTIVAQIEACNQVYRLDAKTIIDLKNQGVDDRVIEALIVSGH